MKSKIYENRILCGFFALFCTNIFILCTEYTIDGGDRVKIKWRPLLICVAIPLAVGGLAALLTGDSMSVFSELEKPPLSPPGWLFPVVWSILYILMGIASYLVLTSDADKKAKDGALWVYGLQLFVNFFWPILFFRLELYTISFVWLLFLWLLILVTFARFWRISMPAAWLLVPYLVWVTFAGYLNLGVALLN